MAVNNYFSIPLFFVIFREALEVAIIVSVLLSFLDRIPHQTNKLARMVWIGTAVASLICLVIGGVFISVWYLYGRNLFEENEMLIEGVLMLLASIFITLSGLAFARGNDMYERMTKKLTKKIEAAGGLAMEGRPFQEGVSQSPDLVTEDDSTVSSQEGDLLNSKSNLMLFFTIPFLTVLRDGLEAILLFAGVGFTEPLSSIPLASICGIVCGVVIGVIMHRLSGKLSLRWFFVISAYILFIMAAGMFSKAIGEFEEYSFVKDMASQGMDPEVVEEMALPLYRNNLVWYFPYWNAKDFLGFGVLKSLTGYKHIATVPTIVAYCGYWIVVIITILSMKFFGDRKKNLAESAESQAEKSPAIVVLSQ